MASSKYQEVAKRILGFKEGDFKLDMCSYTGYDHTCGTSYCLAGWLAHQDELPSEYIIDGEFDYCEYSENLIGDEGWSIKWDFLFCAMWSNTLESAHKRAQYVLENDKVPPEDEWAQFGGRG